MSKIQAPAVSCRDIGTNSELAKVLISSAGRIGAIDQLSSIVGLSCRSWPRYCADMQFFYSDPISCLGVSRRGCSSDDGISIVLWANCTPTFSASWSGPDESMDLEIRRSACRISGSAIPAIEQLSASTALRVMRIAASAAIPPLTKIPASAHPTMLWMR